MREIRMERFYDQDNVARLRVKHGEGTLYRRIFGGLAWPQGVRPGFLVAVGEELHPDPEHKVRHLRILGEASEHLGAVFIEPEPLFEGATAMRARLLVSEWFAPEGPFTRALADFNRALRDEGKARLRVATPPEYERKGALAYYAHLVRARQEGQKTMHYGESVLPRHLQQSPPDWSGEKFEDWPEVSALLCAVAGLDLIRVREARAARNIGPADGTAGY